MELRVNQITQIWDYAFKEKANVVLIRHAPKSDSNETGLSDKGRLLALWFGRIVIPVIKMYFSKEEIFYCTSKKRTSDTLKLMFPDSDDLKYQKLPELDQNKFSDFIQKQVENFHQKTGKWRGYFLNHTYYFLEKLGGQFDEENPFITLADKMVGEIKKFFACLPSDRLIIYCGHSPQIEIAVEKLFNISVSEFGGFLNPLDSIHLKMEDDDRLKFIARCSPIIGYRDLEAESYF